MEEKWRLQGKFDQDDTHRRPGLHMYGRGCKLIRAAYRWSEAALMCTPIQWPFALNSLVQAGPGYPLLGREFWTPYPYRARRIRNHCHLRSNSATISESGKEVLDRVSVEWLKLSSFSAAS